MKRNEGPRGPAADLTSIWARRPRARVADPAGLLADCARIDLQPETFVWIAAEAASRGSCGAIGSTNAGWPWAGTKRPATECKAKPIPVRVSTNTRTPFYNPPSSAWVNMPPVALPNSTFHDVVSPRAIQPHRLLLHVPDGVPPAAGWPLLVLLDGNAVFATAVDAVRVQASHPTATNVEPGVIAAVGYPTDQPYDPFRRSWDLSPPPGRSYPPFAAGGPVVRTGGALDFLSVIEATILPLTEAAAPIDPQRRSLFGHSFGGLFALLALYTRPLLFRTIVSASPALYWEDEALAPFEEQFRASASNRDLVHRVLLSAGEWEGDALAPFQQGRPGAEERSAHRATTRTVLLAKALTERLNGMAQPRPACDLRAVREREPHVRAPCRRQSGPFSPRSNAMRDRAKDTSESFQLLL